MRHSSVAGAGGGAGAGGAASLCVTACRGRLMPVQILWLADNVKPISCNVPHAT